MIYMTVRRTWRERLFSLPWRPLVASYQTRDFEAERAEAAWRRMEEDFRQLHTTHWPENTRIKVHNLRLAPGLGPAPTPPWPSPAPAPRDYAPVFSMYDQPLPTVIFHEPDSLVSGGGGQFAGAGASDSWDAAPTPPPAPTYEAPAPSPSCDSASYSSDSSSSDTSSCSSSSSD